MMRDEGRPPHLVPDVYTRDLLAELPVLKKIAEIETRILFNLDSSNIQPQDWVTLAQTVHAELSNYDGFVIVHGTDTMAYTASALAFLIPGLDRSIVFTGSQAPLSNVRTDGRTNLVDACHLATMRIPEVSIAFHSKLLRGCRATKIDAWGLSAFASPSCPPLAELGLGVQLAPHILGPRPPEPFDPRIETEVLALRAFPGLNPKLLHGALSLGVRGVLLEAFGVGNVPMLQNSLIPFIEEATLRDVPVVIVSQSARGAVDLARYEGGALAKKAGAIGAGDMSSEAALAKMMIALGRAKPHAQGADERLSNRIQSVRQAFDIARVGEMD